METSSQLHGDIYLKILITLSMFLRYLSFDRRKAFNNGYDTVNKCSNFKWNLVSQINKFQNTATGLGSTDNFLRT